MKRKKLTSLVLAFALVFALVPAFGITAYAADLKVSNLSELRSALSTAQTGDIINLDDVEGFISLDSELVVPEGVTVNICDDVYFLVRSAMINAGTLVISGAVNIEDAGSLINRGLLINNGRIGNNGNGMIRNDGLLVSNTNIVNHATVENNGTITNDGWLGNYALFNNKGTIDSKNANSNMVNGGILKNSGEITAILFYNDDYIENYGTICNMDHWNNVGGIIDNFAMFINDGYFANYEGTVNNNGGSITGDGAWVGNDPVEKETFIRAEAAAFVDKLKGNQNLLTITITEYFTGKPPKSFSREFMIDNNAAGTYTVGDYKVFVNTKGNVQIREIYIVK